MNEVMIKMDIPDGAIVVIDRHIADLFTYWIEMTAPYMIGDVGHAISWELWGRKTERAEA